jgi:hypothetical protein
MLRYAWHTDDLNGRVTEIEARLPGHAAEWLEYLTDNTKLVSTTDAHWKREKRIYISIPNNVFNHLSISTVFITAYAVIMGLGCNVSLHFPGFFAKSFIILRCSYAN